MHKFYEHELTLGASTKTVEKNAESNVKGVNERDINQRKKHITKHLMDAYLPTPAFSLSIAVTKLNNNGLSSEMRVSAREIDPLE